MLVSLGRGLEGGKSSCLCLSLPFLRVGVAGEENSLMLGEGAREELINGGVEILLTLKLVCEVLKGFCNRGVENDVTKRNILRRANHSELKLVAGKRKGRGPVSVGRVLSERGHGGNTERHILCRLLGVDRAVYDGIDNSLKLVAKEDRDNCRGRLVTAETAVVSCGCRRNSEKVLIVVDRLDNCGKGKQEKLVFHRLLAGLQEVDAGIRAERPVVMLTRAVDALKGLLCKQARHTVLGRKPLHKLHSKQVLVDRDICGRENGGKLVLCGSRLVMLGL